MIEMAKQKQSYRKAYLENRLKEHAGLEKMCKEGLAELKKALEGEDYKRIDELAYDTALFLKELDISGERVSTGMIMGFCYIKDNKLSIDDKKYEEARKKIDEVTAKILSFNEKAQSLDDLILKLKNDGKPVNCIINYMNITDFVEHRAAVAELQGKENTDHYIK